ncbi:MAG: HlyD family efflux transporter periplasmic adaptor subunit [Legionellaceae bacterium]|nr:HlyD family efflux transporter periplasmic adaptor subunit [Legionellaceae bacterium]
MGISLKRTKLDEKSTVQDYGAGKRAAPKFRWFLIVGLVSLPLLALMYMLLDETLLADFQGVVVFDTVTIRTPDAGYVEHMYVNEGEQVKKDQDLLQFKSPTLDSELAYLNKEKERIEKRSLSINRESTASLEANLKHLKRDIARSQVVYDKFLAYYAPKGHVAALKLEEARRNLSDAKQAYSQLQHQIKQIKLENDVLMEVNYKRPIEDINNKINQINIKKQYFLIKSPEEGAVKVIRISPGEFLPVGEEIVEIITNKDLHVVAFIDPKEAEEVHPKTKVKLTFPDHFSVEGEVMNVPSHADSTPLAFQSPLATRENKLIVIIHFIEALPEKYQVYGVPVDVSLE